MADGVQIEGVDYAFPPHPNIAQLAAAGIRFACRYGGPGTSGKWLTLSEAQALNAAGIAVVANAEGSASGLAGGFAAGASWARSAEAHFRACGMPPDRPIYLSVDFDTTSGDWDELDAAMDGAASVIGRDRVGVYGEYTIIEHFAANQKARWYWQTYAWSSGRWSVHNHIEQYHNDVTLAGAKVDLNRALTSDYGQWTIGGQAMNPQELQAQFQSDMNTWQERYDTLHDHDVVTHLKNIWSGAAEEFPNAPVLRAKRIEAGVAELLARPPVQAAPIDQAALDAAVANAITDPKVLAAIAKAVNDDAAARLEK